MWRWRYPQLRQGLVGAWCPSRDAARGTVRLTDQSLYRNHGTLTNMDPATDWIISPGAGGGYALDFDGTDDYVSVPHWGATPTTEITVAGWILLKTFAYVTFAKKYTQLGWYYYVGVHNSGVNQRFYIEGSGNYCNAATGLTQSVWQHVAFTRGSGVVQFYLNGVAITTTPQGSIGTAVIDDTGAMSIGAAGESSSLRDDLRIYNRCLAPPEMSLLYLLGRGGAYALEYVPIGKAGGAAPVTRNDNLLLMGVS